MGSFIAPLSALANAGLTSAAAAAAAQNAYTTLRDYQHASKIFRRNNSSRAPKTKNWFHIYFELDPGALTAVTTALNSGTTANRVYWKPNELAGLGVLAKTCKLPNFKFDTKKSNQYNRWSLNTTKINYESIDISFWDDTINIIRGFWYAYYQYMIQDPSYADWNSPLTTHQGMAVPGAWSPTTNGSSSLYSSSDNWSGYYGMDTVTAGVGPLNRNNPFFRSIRIYQFNRDTSGTNTFGDAGVGYTEYVLVNPIITGFDHDNVDMATSEFMTNKMMIEYETVLYNSGFIPGTNNTSSDSEIASWDYVRANFLDLIPSPLTGFQNHNNSQLGAILGAVVGLATEGIQLAAGTGQATPASFLTTAIGSATSVNNILANPSGAPVIVVPRVTTGYGTSGQPPQIF